MATQGGTCVNKGNLWFTQTQETRLWDSFTLSGSGEITQFCVYFNEAPVTTYIRLQIFRSNGLYWDFVAESEEFSITTLIEENSKTFILSSPISFQAGDYLALTMRGSDNVYVDVSTSVDTDPVKAGHITSNTLKTSWSTKTNGSDWALLVTYNAFISGKYFLKTAGLDSNNGQTWESAWKTVDKAANTLTDGEEVQIEGGTYNAEPAANNIAPVNAGTTGIKYTVWGSASTGTNDGTGIGTVTVEKNT